MKSRQKNEWIISLQKRISNTLDRVLSLQLHNMSSCEAPVCPQLDQMIAKIKADFQNDESGPNVEQYLRDYVNSGATDYRSYVFFNEHKYARNLVEINEHFELMVCFFLIFLKSKSIQILIAYI